MATTLTFDPLSGSFIAAALAGDPGPQPAPVGQLVNYGIAHFGPPPSSGAGIASFLAGIPAGSYDAIYGPEPSRTPIEQALQVYQLIRMLLENERQDISWARTTQVEWPRADISWAKEVFVDWPLSLLSWARTVNVEWPRSDISWARTQQQWKQEDWAFQQRLRDMAMEEAARIREEQEQTRLGNLLADPVLGPVLAQLKVSPQEFLENPMIRQDVYRMAYDKLTSGGTKFIGQTYSEFVQSQENQWNLPTRYRGRVIGPNGEEVWADVPARVTRVGTVTGGSHPADESTIKVRQAEQRTGMVLYPNALPYTPDWSKYDPTREVVPPPKPTGDPFADASADQWYRWMNQAAAQGKGTVSFGGPSSPPNGLTITFGFKGTNAGPY